MTMTTRLNWNGPVVDAKKQHGAARGLGLASEHVLGVSREQVPIEEATLERSGVASVDELLLEAAISYDTPYAVRQHEELTWKHDPGRKAKYLEDPMTSEAGVVAEIVAAEIRRGFG